MKKDKFLPAINVNTDDSEQKGYITLPFTDQEFKDFFSSLLGSPQSISRDFLVAFDCSATLLKDLKALLEQRIVNQNDGKIINFWAILYFSDLTKVEINNFDEFVAYNDVGKYPCIRLEVNFDFLVKFPTKKFEKQSIQISFFAFTEHLGGKNQESKISYRIEHTNRTWGYDIKSIIDDFIINNSQEYNQITKFFMINIENILLFTAILIMSLSTLSFINLLQPNEDLRKAFFELKTNDLTTVGKKIENLYFLTTRISGNSSIFLIFMPFAVFFTLLSKKAKSFLFSPLVSYIEFSSAHKNNKKFLTKKYSKARFITTQITLISVILAILGNGFYDLLKFILRVN